MTFTVEIVLRERDYAVTEQLPAPGGGLRVPAQWNDADVEQLLKDILLAIDRARDPKSTQTYVALRGFSWIVEPTTDGVVIAIEIPWARRWPDHSLSSRLSWIESFVA